MTTSRFNIFLILAFIASFSKAEDSSLNNTNSESSESKAIIALENLLNENRRLKADFEDAKVSAANAFNEAEIFRRQHRLLSEHMEILGGNASDPSKLEQRLLQAVHDLQLSEKLRKDLAQEALRLSQCSAEFIKNPDAESKTVLDAQLHKLDEVLFKTAVRDSLGQTDATFYIAPDLMNAKVSALKPELACVIINVGAKQGVKVGAPFQVRRNDKVIAYIRIVDVRQAFAGSVIQNLVSSKDPIQLGDTIKVYAHIN